MAWDTWHTLKVGDKSCGADELVSLVSETPFTPSPSARLSTEAVLSKWTRFRLESAA